VTRASDHLFSRWWVARHGHPPSTAKERAEYERASAMWADMWQLQDAPAQPSTPAPMAAIEILREVQAQTSRLGEHIHELLVQHEDYVVQALDAVAQLVPDDVLAQTATPQPPIADPEDLPLPNIENIQTGEQHG